MLRRASPVYNAPPHSVRASFKTFHRKGTNPSHRGSPEQRLRPRAALYFRLQPGSDLKRHVTACPTEGLGKLGAGKAIYTIPSGARENLGGKEGRTLYVTAQTGVYSIDVEGVRAR